MDDFVKTPLSVLNFNLLEKMAANLQEMIFQVVQQPDGLVRVEYVSSNCLQLCELQPEVVKTFQTLPHLIYPQDMQAVIESLQVSKITLEPWVWEGRIVTPSGKTKWIQAVSRPERQANGDMIWRGLVMDVTVQKLAEGKLRASEARYKAILDAIPDLMFRINSDGEYLDFKGEGANVTIPRTEIIGKKLWDFLPPDVARISYAAICRTLELRSLQTCEYQLQTPMGMRDYEARLAVSGQDEVLAIVRDITERKQAEVALRSLAQKYSKAFRCSPDPITISTLVEGRYIEVNDSFVRLTGFGRDEAVGKTAFDLNIWANQCDRAQLIQDLQLHGAVCDREIEFRCKSGKVVSSQLSAEIIDLEGVECILAINKDITERKIALSQLHITSLRDRLLAETLSRIRKSLNLNEILQTTVTEVRKFLNADRVFIALNHTNVESCQILAESVDSYYPSALNWKPSQADEAQFQELRTLLETNRVRVVENANQTELSPTLKALYQTLQTQATLAVPIILGDELFGVLIANQCSSPRNWQSMEIDLLQQISEQLAIAIQQAQLYQELTQLNTNLEQQVEERTAQLQQKMQQIKQLNRIRDVVLHTVSHELRTSVMGNLMVLNNLLAQGEGNREWAVGSRGDKGEKNISLSQNSPTPYSLLPTPSSITVPCSIIERMIQGNERQLGMINSLLEIHSSDAEGIIMHQEVVRFHTLIEAILQDVTSVLNRYQSQLKNLIGNNFPNVKADQELLRKVFVNLLTYSCQNNSPELKFTLKAKVDTSHIRCTIQDNGVGISKQECDRFFDLFVRDPQSPSSTSASLKLYMCRQIIKAHNGEIGVTSNRKGLTFWFTLPLETGSSKDSES